MGKGYLVFGAVNHVAANESRLAALLADTAHGMRRLTSLLAIDALQVIIGRLEAPNSPEYLFCNHAAPFTFSAVLMPPKPRRPKSNCMVRVVSTAGRGVDTP